MSIFTGSGVAIVTPMRKDGSINFDAFGNLVEEQIKEGTDCIIVCGTTGESSTMSHDEDMACIKFVIDKVNKRVPVVAGTGSNCTATAIKSSRDAEELGADGLLLVTPYYNKATQNGLIKHFTAIADSVNIPCILYNVPSRTGCNILPETAIAIAKASKNVKAIKEASSNISQIASLAHLISAEGLDFDIYSGNDDQIVPILSLGGKGVISVLANVAPRQTHDIVAKYLEGDVKESMRLQLEAMPLIKALFMEVNPIPVKAALNLMGREAGVPRLPLTEMETVNREKLAGIMRDYGIL